MHIYTVAPFVAGAPIAFLAVLSPISAIAFCAFSMALLLFDVWQDRARERRREKIIAEARVHTDLLDEGNFREHLPPIKRALDMINGK